MRDGFDIDLDSLEEARRALTRLVSRVDANPVQDLDAPGEAYGHAGLGKITAGFAEAWQKSIDQYLQEIGYVVDGLSDNAETYREIEQKIADAFGRMEA